jgi:hypothetical protein
MEFLEFILKSISCDLSSSTVGTAQKAEITPESLFCILFDLQLACSSFSLLHSALMTISNDAALSFSLTNNI